MVFNNKNYYAVLGLDNCSPIAEVKAVFRQLAVINHPDKGGDAEKMKKITEAYNVISRHKAEYDDWLKPVAMPRVPFSWAWKMQGTNHGWTSTTNMYDATS